MKLLEQHKAGIITFLISGTVVLAMFSIQLKQRGELISESYYELEPEPEVKDAIPEDYRDMEDLKNDKAFNEDEEFKSLMRNFKSVSADDFERTTESNEVARSDEIIEESSLSETVTNHEAKALNSEETASYQKLQEELNKRLENKRQADEHSESRSTLTYSLLGRALEFYKTPRYLCELGGKIVVTIKVDKAGNVVDTSINGASTSGNQCLIDHALDYAKTAKFSRSEKKNQIGTITFLFKGKG